MTNNKLLVFMAIGFVILFSLSSCTPAEQKCYNKFSNFVNEFEEEAPNYTEQDWEVNAQLFEAYSNDLDAFSQLYTPEQNREIGRLKARYHKTLLKYYVNRASDFFNNISYQMEGYTEEMTGIIDEEKTDIIEDETEITKSMDCLEKEISGAAERFVNSLDIN